MYSCEWKRPASSPPASSQPRAKKSQRPSVLGKSSMVGRSFDLSSDSGILMSVGGAERKQSSARRPPASSSASARQREAPMGIQQLNTYSGASAAYCRTASRRSSATTGSSPVASKVLLRWRTPASGLSVAMTDISMSPYHSRRGGPSRRSTAAPRAAPRCRATEASTSASPEPRPRKMSRLWPAARSLRATHRIRVTNAQQSSSVGSSVRWPWSRALKRVGHLMSCV
mmetsp:Transcript_7830/g.22986  ORF Transcript_7830/g.22986 Transcript_7830/m.22986 type:complete len:228 (+) Transcript_7830:378-1061(+)